MKRSQPSQIHLKSLVLLNISTQNDRKFQLSVVAVHIDEIKATSKERKEPRIVDKLTLCCNNDGMLFDSDTSKQILLFLNLQAKPVCLLSSDGLKEDIKHLYNYLAIQQESESMFTMGKNFTFALSDLNKKQLHGKNFLSAETENLHRLSKIRSDPEGFLRNLDVVRLPQEENTQVGADQSEGPHSCKEKEAMVFYDLETTGLRRDNRFITEICMIATTQDNLLSCQMDELLQNCDKIVLVVDPGSSIDPDAQSITNLTNQTINRSEKLTFNQGAIQAISSFLSRQSQQITINRSEKLTFNQGAIQAISSFLSRQSQQICLLAHNGSAFDFPILRSQTQENVNVTSPLLTCTCADTLLAFRKLSKKNGKKEPNGLMNLYDRCFPHQKQENAHHAESDVIAMMKVTKHMSGVIDLLTKKNFYPDKK